MPYTHKQIEPHYFVAQEQTNAQSFPARPGFRGIARDADERTAFACMIPAGCICGNSVPTVSFNIADGNDDGLGEWFVGHYNSFLCEYMLRFMVTANVNLFLVSALPMPRDRDSCVPVKAEIDLIMSQMRSVDDVSDEATLRCQFATARAKLDAAIARNFDVCKNEMARCVATFPLLDRNDNLVLHSKAETAVEHFIVARYIMSKAVYHHKTVFAFEALMRQTLFLLREQGELWKSGTDIEKLVKDRKEFLTFHDGRIDSIIETQADGVPRASALGRLCRALRDRKPPRLVWEVSSLTRKDGSPSKELTRFVTRRGDHLKEVAKKCRIPIECWLWEDSNDVAFEKFGPLMSMSEAASVSPQASGELVRLLDKTGKTALLIDKPSSILHHLSSLRLQMARLYVVEEDKAKITKAERAVKAWLKP